MQDGCVFCRIIAGKVSAKIVYQDDEITAFWDQRPATKVHILIVPNRHIASVNEANEEDAALLGRLMLTAREIAAEHGVRDTGYRLIVNVGEGGGQTVYHLHLHLFAGTNLPTIHR